ncbi:hypothetical protein F4859DRAFT_506015 [Xylaria cf. heliscus]|nr:hypothetical protein F4859DRAFT_506015 [Xylaria cf. heliscus]
MESNQEGASPTDANHRMAEVNEPNSVSTTTSNEAANIDDLRKRFAAIEARISIVDEIFGFQQLAKVATQDDSDSISDDSDLDGFPSSSEMTFFSDAMHMMHQARVSFRRVEHYRTHRRASKKKDRELLKGYHVNRVQRESANQIIMTAILNSEPATIVWMGWDRFMYRKGEIEESLMTPIDAVIGEPEPQLIDKIFRQMARSPKPTAGGKFSGTRVPDRGTSTEDLEQTPLPERIKIHSPILPQILTGLDNDHKVHVADDKTAVFLRPFRTFLYYEKILRDRLNRLEKRFQNLDGIGKSYRKENVDVAGKNISEESGDPNTDILNTGSIKGEEEIGVDKEERPKDSGVVEKLGAEGKGEDERETAESILALFHLRCLMGYIESDRCRRILFDDLWHLFKPGDEVIDQTEKQVYRVIRVRIPRHKGDEPWLRRYRGPSSEEEDEDGLPMTVHCAYIDFDGKQLGPVSLKFGIPPFEGLKDIKLLPIYPLRFAKDPNLRDTLIARSKMLLDIAKFKPMYYTGLTLDTRDEIDSQVVVDFSEALSDEKRKKWTPVIASLCTPPENRDPDRCGSVCCCYEAIRNDEYIDTRLAEEFLKSLIPDAPFRARSLILSPRPLEESLPGTDNEPTDDELVVMTYRVFGFVLRSRKWAQLDLTFLKYENADARNSVLGAFNRLELPDGHREMVRSLVTQHFRDKQTAFARDDQTDLVKGKGKGLILLLHGAPGVGKTTTAEGVAELFQKPLFQITCGDLGTTAREVEQELEKNFALASRWGCILLLDEADVFLSARERKDFERNGLVAVFLRVLEYYAGILFLTTNRIGDVDEAFASRIHMSLYYPELDESKTKKVFKLNLDLIQERFDKQGRKITYDASSIEDFAKKHFSEHPYSRWNGRQIRNGCQTALALAEFDAHGGKIQGELDKTVEVKLQLKHFQLVQTAYLDFGRYLGDIRGTQGDRRAIDYGFRARSNTPYQTTPSRFSAAAATSMRDSRHSSSLSTEYNNDYHSRYPSQGGGPSIGPFQPFTNHGGAGGPGGGQGAGRGSNMEHQIHEQYGPPQGQMGPGSGYDSYGYESPQGRGYMNPGNQRYQQQSNLQGQNWGSPGMSQGYLPAEQSQHGQGQGSNPLRQQYYQGQPRDNFGNMQRGGDVQNHTMQRPESTAQNQYTGGGS